jgi:hypothetical protein
MRSILLALFAVFLVSCASQKPGTAGSGPQAPLQGFRYSETGEFYQNRPLNPQDTTVDYKSTINIEPALSNLAQHALPNLTPDEKQEMQSLGELAQSLNSVIENWSRVGQDLEKMVARKRPLTPDEIAKMQQELTLESLGRARILSAIITYATCMATNRTGIADTNNPDFLKEFEAITTPLITDSDGNPVILNVDRVRQMFRDELERYVQDAETVRKSSAQVRIRAFLDTKDKQHLPIHVGNYDNIDNPVRQQEDRITYGSQSDREQLAQEYQAASAIADFANTAMTNKAGLQASFRDIGHALESDFTNLDSVLQGLITNQAALFQAIDSLKALGTTNQVEHISALQLFMTNSIAISGQIQGLLRTSGSNSTDIVQVSSAFLNTAGDIAAILQQLQPDVIVQGAGDLAAIAARQLTSTNMPDKDKLQHWATNVIPNTEKVLKQYKVALNRIQPLLTAIAGVHEGAVAASAGEDVVDPRVKPQNLATAPPGFIDLVNLANRGDKVEVKTELVNTESNALIQEYPARVFGVDKFGLSDTLSANVIFVDRYQDNGGGAKFVAAPSVSWTLHYRMPLKPDSSTISKLFYHADPGVGLSVSALNFDNSGVQAGMGGHISFFHDVILAGAGYNLNASHDNGYLFIGIGIFESLKEAGNLFGGK